MEQEDNLAAIKEGVETLLPEEVCERYEECQTTQEESKEMSRRWLKLSVRLQKNLELLDQKVRDQTVYAFIILLALAIAQLPALLEQFSSKFLMEFLLYSILAFKCSKSKPSLSSMLTSPQYYVGVQFVYDEC